MKYKNIYEGVFIERINRFVAKIEINGSIEICHVKNTGRCKELLIKGAKVYVEKTENPTRKTQYDLISVVKNREIINMDSQAPNKVFGEWVKEGGFFDNIALIKPECKYKNSRFDFYIEANKKIFVEIKGVTLEENGVVMFPDAPTQRGIKHINELIESTTEGYEAYIFFIIQMKKCLYFTPNYKTHPEFANALNKAKKSGVNIRALNCFVSPDELKVNDFVEVRL